MRGRAETLIEPRGPHASREMLGFFLEHPRNPPELTGAEDTAL